MEHCRVLLVPWSASACVELNDGTIQKRLGQQKSMLTTGVLRLEVERRYNTGEVIYAGF